MCVNLFIPLGGLCRYLTQQGGAENDPSYRLYPKEGRVPKRRGQRGQEKATPPCQVI